MSASSIGSHIHVNNNLIYIIIVYGGSGSTEVFFVFALSHIVLLVVLGT
jgi:hypothetical protein